MSRDALSGSQHRRSWQAIAACRARYVVVNPDDCHGLDECHCHREPALIPYLVTVPLRMCDVDARVVRFADAAPEVECSPPLDAVEIPMDYPLPENGDVVVVAWCESAPLGAAVRHAAPVSGALLDFLGYDPEACGLDVPS